MVFNYSIIIPYRDRLSLFQKAIESIPDRKDIQLIIVDNAPQPLLQDQIPVKLLARVEYTKSSPVKGAGCARNVGLEKVKGRFILFLDADDYFSNEAFQAFDRYLDDEYDIVFFKTTSICIPSGTPSTRHIGTCSLIEHYIQTKDDEALRYRWYGPIAKLFKARFVLENNFKFEEIKVANDAWFSVITGHNAKSIAVDGAIVYVITEGEQGSSLTKQRNRENYFTRFENDVKINNFLKEVNHYKMRNRLLGSIRIAFVNYGFLEMVRYLRYASKHKAGIF